MTYWKNCQLLGALPPDPCQGLCPWTPLGTYYSPQTPASFSSFFTFPQSHVWSICMRIAVCVHVCVCTHIGVCVCAYVCVCVCVYTYVHIWMTCNEGYLKTAIVMHSHVLQMPVSAGRRWRTFTLRRKPSSRLQAMTMTETMTVMIWMRKTWISFLTGEQRSHGSKVIMLYQDLQELYYRYCECT